MIGALARFVALLRDGGLTVSPAEIVDAGRALDLVGLTRREVVRAALRATLAKDRSAAETFDRLFDLYFTAPKRPGRGAGEARPGAAGERPRGGAGERTVTAAAKPRERETEPSRSRRPRLAPSDGERRSEEERLVRRGRRPRTIVRQRRPREGDRDPCHADLSRRMTTEEERAIASEVPRMIQALRLQAGRRLTRARTGRPWLRRVLRENLSRGGVPFVIPFRARRPRKTRVVLLVDVSFSVARAAGLFLWMAGAFVALGRRARVFVFVDRPVDATAAIARWISGRSAETTAQAGRPAPRIRSAPRAGAGVVANGVAFADVLDGIPGLNLEAPSDYGRAFHALLTARRRPRGRDTVLVVLGDGRTNRFEPLGWALDELARGCRLVLWLVPEPAVRWGTADSALPAYLHSVDLAVEATDLLGLTRGLSLLLRRL
jgi:uncharacterized protein with von Willebrand factor type A (vWA) domain